MVKLNICFIGDPVNPRTWSGTPYHLYSELQKMNCLGRAFNSSSKAGKLLKYFSMAYYGGTFDTGRGMLIRYLNANKAKRVTAKSNTNLTLHAGTLDLPFFRPPKKQKHYLFCDSTWKLWSTFSTIMNRYPGKLVRDAEKMEKKAYHQVEHIFTISEYVRNNLIDHYGVKPEKVTVVGTGLGVIKPYFGEKDYANGKILFAAKERFEDKGGQLVLDAFKIAVAKNPGLELTVVGQNDFSENIHIPRVRTLGYVPIEKLQDIFNTCSVMLMPAVNEPWGLVYLEALACKMPIIGMNRNSFPEISGYGRYGFGLDEPDAGKLATILLNCFDNPEKLKEMGQKGQEFCLQKFSWEATVHSIVTTIAANDE